MNQRQRRWLKELADYDLEVLYKPGKSNVVADALSRRPDYLLASMSAVVPSQNYLSVLREYWTENAPEGDKYFEKDGLFYERGQDHELRMVIPAVPETEQLRRTIMSEVHDCAYSGHLGFDKTLEMVKRTVVWRGMHEVVKGFVATCATCQQTKHSTRKKAGMLQPLPVPERIWEQISMDLLTQLPVTGRGNDAIIVFVDRMSKMIRIAPTQTKVTAPGCAKLLVSNVVKHYGIPKAIVSDRDARFTSHFWQALMGSMGTKLLMSSPD